MIEDIKFIKTDKEGVELQNIQNDYPNSIIDVNSQSEKNIYIGSERVTDNYNLGKEYIDSITNNVGGMTSGINASELKGKSVSEILDIILFASNNDMTLKGVQVVDKIENLTDSTLEDVYQGMVVSVVEDNSLYILLTDSNVNREWKKVGADIDIEALKTSTKKLSAPITVAGLSGSLGANISNGKTYTTDNTIEDILRDLLCKEIYPNVSLSTTNPKISFDGITGEIVKDYQSLMEVGSVLELNPITLSEATITKGHRVGNGFTYGYSSTNDNNKDGSSNPPKKDGDSSLVGSYILTEEYIPSSIGYVRTTSSSENHADVKFDKGSVIIGLGDNTIAISATSRSGTYSHPEYPEYYVVSNLGNTKSDAKLENASKTSGTLDSITNTASVTVTGVYPVYVNISSDKLIDEPRKMSLTAGKIFEFDVPSEVLYGKHFTFDYPATHSVVSFEIKDLTGNYVSYSATYNVDSNDSLYRYIAGVEIRYKRFVTTGKLQGEGTYKITLSKGLDE